MLYTRCPRCGSEGFFAVQREEAPETPETPETPEPGSSGARLAVCWCPECTGEFTVRLSFAALAAPTRRTKN